MPTSEKGVVVFNHDVVGLYNRLNRYGVELYRSTSADVIFTNTYDQVRLGKYLDSLLQYCAWVVSQPQLDLPRTSPRPYTLEAPPVFSHPENEEIADVLRILETCRDELITSQSASMGSGLIEYDKVRFVSSVNKMQDFLSQYIAKVTPVDLPETGSQPPTEVPVPSPSTV